MVRRVSRKRDLSPTRSSYTPKAKHTTYVESCSSSRRANLASRPVSEVSEKAMCDRDLHSSCLESGRRTHTCVKILCLSPRERKASASSTSIWTWIVFLGEVEEETIYMHPA
jgi:hypothetical protein